MKDNLVHIPFHGTDLVAEPNDGNPLVALRPACEAIGLAYARQLEKLHKKSWAVVHMKATTGSDGKTYQMAMVDRRTLTMWLATVEPSRVSESIRPMLEAYQNEAADALDSYFHEGGAINPEATEDQIDRLSRQAKLQMEVLALARGLVDRNWLEAKTRIVVGRAMGETPEVPKVQMPLYVESYLQEKGLKGAQMKATRAVFGRRAAALYKEEHGRPPQKSPGEVGGRVREINAYVEADRWLFDKLWTEDFAALLSPTLFEEVTA